MDVFYDGDKQLRCCYSIMRDDVEACDSYEEFRSTIIDIIEEQTGYKLEELEEPEQAWIDMCIQIWSNHFPRI